MLGEKSLPKLYNIQNSNQLYMVFLLFYHMYFLSNYLYIYSNILCKCKTPRVEH